MKHQNKVLPPMLEVPATLLWVWFPNMPEKTEAGQVPELLSSLASFWTSPVLFLWPIGEWGIILSAFPSLSLCLSMNKQIPMIGSRKKKRLLSD